MAKENENSTPAEQGYRHPAEWAPHDATWLCWPSNSSDWPGKFQPIPWVFAEMVRKIAPGERIELLVSSPQREAQARRMLLRAGAPLDRVAFRRVKTNRGWLRDAGPIFLTRKSNKAPLAIADFRFNAWAKYPDWKLDDAIPQKAAKALGIPRFEIQAESKPFVLEGGSIDVNGAGDLLTTEECLLDREIQARNPHLDREGIEKALKNSLGVKEIHWLGKGIAGDDTHGHVDDLCRFVNETTVVLVRENNPNDANYASLNENRERLQGLRLSGGGRPDVVELPMPELLCFDGQRLPASYANFYISNAAVLVPTFNDPNDRIALGILGELFTDRSVVGVSAVDLIWGLGAFHCLTHEQPAVE